MQNQKKFTVRSGLLGALVLVSGGVLGMSLLVLSPAGGASEGGGEGQPPALVEHEDGAEVARITLTERAADRIDVRTEATRRAQVGGRDTLVIPYGALLYDAQGATWTYTSPEPLVFVRAPVQVHSIKGDRVFLTDGPAEGTPVVSVGATELFGAEFGVGH